MSLVYDYGDIKNVQSVDDSNFRLKQHVAHKADMIGKISQQMGLGMDQINKPYELNLNSPAKINSDGTKKQPFDDFIVDHSALAEQQHMFEQFKAKQTADAMEAQGYNDLADQWSTNTAGNPTSPAGNYTPGGENRQGIKLHKYNGGVVSVYDTSRNGKMYNSFTGLSGNKNYRNNNWFNISGVGMKTPGYGAAGFNYGQGKHLGKGDVKMLVFKTPKDGVKAGYKLVSGSSYNRGNINSMFAKYQEDKGAHVRNMKKLQGMGIPVYNKSFNQLSKDQQLTFMNQMVAKEGDVQGGKVTWDMIFN